MGHEAGVIDALPPGIDAGVRSVLIVEDERDLLDLLSNCLRSFGYAVLTAGDGEDALRVFSRRHADIDLVLTDLGLPRLSGESLILKVRTIKPAVKIIVMSGYSDAEARTEVSEAGISLYLQKPYTVRMMLNAVGEVLECA